MKILIVEDETELRKILETSLREDGHTVEAEGNGKDGLIRSLHQDYDLIILDIMLPEMNGWQILEKLRAKKDTPVLMLTAKDTPADQIRSLDLGSDDYVIKPFHLDSLKARIRALFRRAQGKANPMFTISEGVELDSNTRRVFKDGTTVDLTAKELNLLEIFLQRRDQVLSKDRIADLLFENGAEGESNTIEVYIYNLRKKLGRSIIKTRRNIGYEFSK